MRQRRDSRNRVRVEWVCAGDALESVGGAVAIGIIVRVEAGGAIYELPNITHAVAVKVDLLRMDLACGAQEQWEQGETRQARDGFLQERVHKRIIAVKGAAYFLRLEARAERSAADWRVQGATQLNDAKCAPEHRRKTSQDVAVAS